MLTCNGYITFKKVNIKNNILKFSLEYIFIDLERERGGGRE